MTLKATRQSIEYWEKTATRDYETMRALFRMKRYPECLFFGHIVLEKILKAYIVQHTKQQAPYIHDLVRLQSIAGLNLPKEILIFLNEINDFNIRARYPEYKLEFYKRCTKSYAEKYKSAITILYQKLCRGLKQKKS